MYCIEYSLEEHKVAYLRRSVRFPIAAIFQISIKLPLSTQAYIMTLNTAANISND